MEYDKINNLLLSQDNESEKLSKFVTREYVRVNGLSNTYNENKSIRFKTPMLRFNLCDYSDVCILVKGTITVTAPGANNGANNIRDKKNKPLILKSNAPFVSCITRINGELIEDAADLDIVMSMYNLLEYSKNYRKTIGSLYNYYRDELSLVCGNKKSRFILQGSGSRDSLGLNTPQNRTKNALWNGFR